MVTVTVYGADGCWKCANTIKALDLAGIEHRYRDVPAEGLADELRDQGVRELPLVVTDTGERWTGLRLDKIVELSRLRAATA
jgi:glutaredoxin-like protein NrdH